MTSLLIRADASVDIGTGHVMRCLALAQHWQTMGGTVHLLTANTVPSALRHRLQSEHVTIHNLSAIPGTTKDADETSSYANEVTAALIAVDGYHFDSQFQQYIKQSGWTLLVLDDFGHADHYYGDFVLNQNIYADESFYRSREPYTKLLLGTQYTLLRREFWPYRGFERQTPDKAQKILVTMGGSDPHNLTHWIIQALEDVNTTLSLQVVVGGANPHHTMIEEASRVSKHEITLLSNVTDMPALMAEADLAISAGGSTCWEMAFMGLPMCLIIVADNQVRVAEGLEQAKVAVNMGWGNVVTSREFFAKLLPLITNRHMRKAMSQRGHQLVNNLGGQRLIKSLLDTLSAAVTHLRQVRDADRELIWKWANDATTRANSFNPESIPWEIHCRWFEEQLTSHDVRFWMLEAFGEAVSHIRYEHMHDRGTSVISFTVRPDKRGYGFGTQLLKQTMRIACKELTSPRLEGVTFASNIASAKAFQKAGFHVADSPVIADRESHVFVWNCDNHDTPHN